MIEVRLDFLLKNLHYINTLISIVLSPLLIILWQRISLVKAMDVFECLAEWTRHLLVQVLMVSLSFVHPILDELVGASLLDVIVEPR